jgi:hypothetical protein
MDPAPMKKPMALPRREVEKVSEINFNPGVYVPPTASPIRPRNRSAERKLRAQKAKRKLDMAEATQE